MDLDVLRRDIELQLRRPDSAGFVSEDGKGITFTDEKGCVQRCDSPCVVCVRRLVRALRSSPALCVACC